ncbi:MAG: TonB-dependent receptor [Acidobacteriaceae bacterium]|nr:TonB-dependent receptor [Acidobacteriaceae bacterium]
MQLKGDALPTVLSLLFLPGLWAQTITTGDVVGTVSDSSGAVVREITVTLRSVGTNAEQSTVTNESGQYRFPLLKPGDYMLSAEGQNLQSPATKLTLLVGQQQAVPLVVTIKGTMQVVEVISPSSVLQTENANQATSFSEMQVRNLPVNGGDITNVAFSVPGVRLNVGGGNGNFNVNGIPFSATLFTLNGADITEPYTNNNKSGASNNTLGANDISEAAVVLNAFSAQYGRMAGAQVNFVTKSGTNQFHGNLSESYNDAIFNANDFFKNATGTPRGRSVANQFAGSLGGPVWKDKTFFFVNVEGLRYALPSTGVVSVPSPQLQQYILAHVPASSVPLYQAAFNLYNGAPGVNRAVPVTNGTGPLQDGNNKLGCGTQGFAGTPVGGGSGLFFGQQAPCALAFGTNASSVNTENYVSARADHIINDKQRVFFRFSDDWGVQASSTSSINPVFNTQSNQPWIIGQLNHSYVINPNLVNNFVASTNWYSAVFGVVDFAKAQSLMPAIFAFNDGGANGSATSSNVGFQGLGASLPVGRAGSQLQFIDDLSWSHGSHTVQVGVNYRHNRVTDSNIASGSQIGTYTFNALSDFASGTINAGTGSRFIQSFPLLQHVHIRLYSLGYYAQDEWRVSRAVKLNYGIRFEQNENPACVDNCFSRFNAAFLGAGYQSGINTPYNATIKTGLYRAFPNLEGVIPEPRFGIVYSPFRANQTIIRAGVGLFANTFPGNLAANIFGNAPNKFTPTVTFGAVSQATDPQSSQAAAIAANGAFQNGFQVGYTLSQMQAALGQVTFSRPTFYTTPQSFASAKVLEWSVELEHTLTVHNVLAVTYSGNHGYSETLTNPGANIYLSTPSRYPGGFAGVPASPPDGRFSSITQLFNNGYSNYHGLSLAMRHAFSLGFEGQISYTWSHALQLGPGITATAPLVYNPYHLQTGYSSTNFDTRHVLIGDLVWMTPSKFRGRILNWVATGWTLGTKMYLYSGRPFSVVNSQIPGLLSTNFGSGAAIVADLLNPSILGISCRDVNTRCFSPADFAAARANGAAPVQTDFGNIPPNSFRGPGFFDLDTQLTKKIPITERAAFELGASAYNLLNHPNFAVPNGNAASGSFGLITSTVSTPTSIYGTGQGAIVSGRVLVVTGRFNF